jgi:hypothetical protein
MGESRGLYGVLERKPERRRPLGRPRPRRRWEDNIQMDLQEMGVGAWTGSMWLRIGTDGRAPVNAVSIECGSFLTS